MQLDIFSPKAPPLFGLDISSSSVKMLEIVDAGKGTYRVERYVIEPLPRDATVDGNISNLEQVVETVKRAMRTVLGSHKNPQVVISSDKLAPYQSVITAMDAARQLGLERLTFATKQSNGNSSP